MDGTRKSAPPRAGELSAKPTEGAELTCTCVTERPSSLRKWDRHIFVRSSLAESGTDPLVLAALGPVPRKAGDGARVVSSPTRRA